MATPVCDGRTLVAEEALQQGWSPVHDLLGVRSMTTYPERVIATSVLVIGTGGSGLRAAIELAESGKDVLAVGKRPKVDAHTSLAAGGINAALATVDTDDT